MAKNKKYIVLHNIRSAHNVGSIFRTADAAGVEKVFLSGHTPQPLDRFGRKQKEISKVALGAEHLVPWKYCEDIIVEIKRLRKENIAIISVEQHESSIAFSEYHEKGDTVYIFGNEVDGVDEDIINASDLTIEIPMLGQKESLNVSVVVGIVLFSASS